MTTQMTDVVINRVAEQLASLLVLEPFCDLYDSDSFPNWCADQSRNETPVDRTALDFEWWKITLGDRSITGTPSSIITSGYSSGCSPDPRAFVNDRFSFDQSSINYDSSFSEQEVDDWQQVLKPPKPRSGYCCRVCYGSDHLVHDCPRAPPKEELNTPYQGTNQCFGMFACKACDREWTSTNSWAEMGQPCHGCKQTIFPFKQFPLDKVPTSKLQKKPTRNAASRSRNIAIC